VGNEREELLSMTILSAFPEEKHKSDDNFRNALFSFLFQRCQKFDELPQKCISKQ